MEGLIIRPIGQGTYRNRANTVGNITNVWEINVNTLVKNLKPGNKNTRAEEKNTSWANKPLKKSTLPPLPPSPKTPNSKSRKQRKTRKSRKTRRQRK